ncbi:MAG: hypothetical protein L6422_11510 [Candidatus Marinimicrobia bacterium]|nr:hypothetical protein [bacterium]MCG2716873.1 hypothetical protein [Candidatus Neomarinimicrobiota bacterium]
MRKNKDIQILNNFALLALPFINAEKLSAAFKTGKKGQGLFITEAKSKRK